jgi:hypothetical protein
MRVPHEEEKVPIQATARLTGGAAYDVIMYSPLIKRVRYHRRARTTNVPLVYFRFKMAPERQEKKRNSKLTG